MSDTGRKIHRPNNHVSQAVGNETIVRLDRTFFSNVSPREGEKVDRKIKVSVNKQSKKNGKIKRTVTKAKVELNIHTFQIFSTPNQYSDSISSSSRFSPFPVSPVKPGSMPKVHAIILVWPQKFPFLFLFFL